LNGYTTRASLGWTWNGVDAIYTLTAHTVYCASVDRKKVKGKVFPYSLPSVGPGADPGVQAVSPQVT